MALSASDTQRLNDLLAELDAATTSFLGYPVSKDFRIEDLLPFLRYPINNLGDPYAESTYRVSTKEFEREVVEFIAAQLRAPAGQFWGYVTNGGTEGNLYGLYLARERYPHGIVYFSEDTHYSVAKNVHFLGMRHLRIRSQRNGEIDYNYLYEHLRINRDAPVILFCNIGTTMTEARDDIRRLIGICDDLGITNRYVHSDAALCGGFAPYLDPRPAFDFADGADSVAISGHKWFGSPIPCGVVVALKSHVDSIARSIGYIGSLDTTITGSRNGFTPLVLWHAIKSLGVDGLRARAEAALEVARYAESQMVAAGIPAWRNPNAITVVFPPVSEALRQKWQLATQSQSHLIVMPNVTRAQVDALVRDLKADYAGRC
jgi:histidine decarboxylase